MSQVVNNIVIADNAFGTIASGLAVGDTALAFTSGHGARFPGVSSGQSLYCCLLNSGNVLEEIKVTAHSSGSDSATIVRGVGGTTAKTWTAGDRIEARLSSESLSLMIAAGRTGEVKLTLQTTPDTGWVMADDGTIGNGSSGATNRANADTVDLFTLLWTNISDTYAPVSTGRGATAAADYAANKTITLTKMLGRALAIAGSGSGLTARSLGQTVGEESHALSTAELASHTHTGTTGGQSATHTHPAVGRTDGALGTAYTAMANIGGAASPVNTDVASNDHTHGFTSDATGSGTAHNTMQPTSFLNAMIKL